MKIKNITLIISLIFSFSVQSKNKDKKTSDKKKPVVTKSIVKKKQKQSTDISRSKIGKEKTTKLKKN